MTDRMTDEALRDLIADTTGGSDEGWFYHPDMHTIWATCGATVIGTQGVDGADIELIHSAKALAAEVLELRAKNQALRLQKATSEKPLRRINTARHISPYVSEQGPEGEICLCSLSNRRTDCPDHGDLVSREAVPAHHIGSANKMAAPAFKPLVWEPASSGIWGDHNTERASSLGGWYYVMDDQDSSCGAVFSEFVASEDDRCTALAREIYDGYCYDEAKAAAQADYEARILAALEVAP